MSLPPSQDPAGKRGPSRATALILAAIAILVFGGIWFAWAPRGPHSSLIGGPFALQDGAGKTVSDESLRGKPFLVYFGYTHCPDICPTELARVSDVLAKMGDKAIPALFITVDPERDTPKVMQDYVSSFDPHVVGLSGSPQAIGAAARAFRVFSRKGPVGADGDYAMDHSSVVYLMDRSGGFIESVSLDRTPEEVAKELMGYL